MSVALPLGFEALESIAQRWALPTMAARANKRDESTLEERAAFYAACQPLIAPVLAHLDAVPLDALSAEDKRLRDLCLGFCHVALAIEIQDDAEAQHAINRHKMIVTHDGSNSAPQP